MGTHRDIVKQIRGRVEKKVSRCLTDAEVLTIALAASCHAPVNLLEGVCNRQIARELSRDDNMKDTAVSLKEFQGLFSTLSTTGVRVEECVSCTIENHAFKKFVSSFESDLKCTLMERDQKLAWAVPAVRVLVYVALHSEVDTEERVNCSIGGVVRADTRRLEDVRASLEDAMDIYSLGASVLTLSQLMCPGGQ